jgi:hypothetical protein
VNIYLAPCDKINAIRAGTLKPAMGARKARLPGKKMPAEQHFSAIPML